MEMTTDVTQAACLVFVFCLSTTNSLNYIIRFILCTGRQRDQLLLVNSLLKQHRTKSSRTFLRGNSQWQRKRLGSWFVEIHFDCFLLGNQLSSVSKARERVGNMGMSLFIQWPWSVFNIHSLKSIVDVMISTSRLSWSWYLTLRLVFCLLCSKLAKISMLFNSPYKTICEWGVQCSWRRQSYCWSLKRKSEAFSLLRHRCDSLLTNESFCVFRTLKQFIKFTITKYQIGLIKESRKTLSAFWTWLTWWNAPSGKLAMRHWLCSAGEERQSTLFFFFLFLNWIYIERFRESLAISLLLFCRHVFSSLGF